jgi:hypothetical protein
MLFAKHAVTSSAGLLGGIFGYVSAESDTVAILAAFGFMFACALIADILTYSWEEDEPDGREGDD